GGLDSLPSSAGPHTRGQACPTTGKMHPPWTGIRAPWILLRFPRLGNALPSASWIFRVLRPSWRKSHGAPRIFPLQCPPLSRLKRSFLVARAHLRRQVISTLEGSNLFAQMVCAVSNGARPPTDGGRWKPFAAAQRLTRLAECCES